MKLEIYYDDRQDFIEITEEYKNIVKKTVETAMRIEKISELPMYELSVSFVSNDEIKQLNNDYRQVDSETDVLSFPMDLVDEDLSELCETDILEMGDIVLSTERIISQAEELGHTQLRETSYLVAHSALHLMGYDHIAEEDKKEMRKMEKEVMKELKIFK